jgi:hypothetical protein
MWKNNGRVASRKEDNTFHSAAPKDSYWPKRHRCQKWKGFVPTDILVDLVILLGQSNKVSGLSKCRYERLVSQGAGAS